MIVDVCRRFLLWILIHIDIISADMDSHGRSGTYSRWRDGPKCLDCLDGVSDVMNVSSRSLACSVAHWMDITCADAVWSGQVSFFVDN